MGKSAIDWLTITKNEGEAGWRRFYQTYMGLPISQPKRFFEAVERLGNVLVFEAVVAASLRTLDGDPLSYVLSIAISKFNDEITGIDSADRYRFNLDKAKHRVALQNDELEEKLHKAKELHGGNAK